MAVLRSKKFRASRALLRRYSKTSDLHWLVPFLLTMIIWLPIARPYSAQKALVTTLYSRMQPTPSVVPASEEVAAPSAFTVNAPSSVKLFERTGAPLALNQVPAEPTPPPLESVCLATPGRISVRST